MVNLDPELARFLDEVNAESAAIRTILQALMLVMLGATSQPAVVYEGVRAKALKKLADEIGLAKDDRTRRLWEMARARAQTHFDDLAQSIGLPLEQDKVQKN